MSTRTTPARRSGSPLRRAAATALAAALLLAGCTSGGSQDSRQPLPPPEDSSETAIDVAAPELVAKKAEAGIEDCPAAQTASGGLPERTLPCLGGGRSVDLSTLKGPLVLNFFFGACAPCQKEMPVLQSFHEKHGDQVPIIGVDSMDTLPGVALDLAADRGVTYPIVADPFGSLQGTELSVRGMPTFFFLEEDGSISRASGGLETEDEMVELVESHLGIDLG